MMLFGEENHHHFSSQANSENKASIVKADFCDKLKKISLGIRKSNAKCV